MTALSSPQRPFEDPFEFDAGVLSDLPLSPGDATPRATPTVGGPPPTPLPLPGASLVDYGVVQIREGGWSATATIEAARIVLETHPATPADERTRIATTARAAHALLAPLLRAVETALRVAMPGLPLPLAPRPPSGSERTILVPAALPAITLQPHLILVSTLANIYLVMYPPGAEWMRFGGTVDLTGTCGRVYEHPGAPPDARLRHELFLRALRRVVGARGAPPPSVVRAMMRADAVGECEPGDESEEESDEGEVDPEMFGG